MIIIYTQHPGGFCPVQAEGTVNGHVFYFRSRGHEWSLSIAQAPGSTDWWHHSEEYPGAAKETPTMIGNRAVKFSAGYAKVKECEEFIEHVAGLWEAQHK